MMLLLIEDIRQMVIADILMCLNLTKIKATKDIYQMRLKMANRLSFLVKNIDKEHRELLFGFIRNNANEDLKYDIRFVFDYNRWIIDPFIRKKLKIVHHFAGETWNELFIEDNWELFLNSQNCL